MRGGARSGAAMLRFLKPATPTPDRLGELLAKVDGLVQQLATAYGQIGAVYALNEHLQAIEQALKDLATRAPAIVSQPICPPINLHVHSGGGGMGGGPTAHVPAYCSHTIYGPSGPVQVQNQGSAPVTVSVS